MLVVNQLVFFFRWAMMDNWYSWVFLTILNGMGTAVMRASPDSSGEVKSSSTLFLRTSKLTYPFPRLLSVMPRTLQSSLPLWVLYPQFFGPPEANSTIWSSGGNSSPR